MNRRLFLFALPALGVCLCAPAQDKPANVAGDWQISWTVRLGAEPGSLHLIQEGSKLSGTWRGLHNSTLLAGDVQGNKVSLRVQFPGPSAYTIAFNGTVDGDKMTGTSEAQNVEGGAYLGHGGEVVHPEHPWTAVRGPEAENAARARAKPGH